MRKLTLLFASFLLLTFCGPQPVSTPTKSSTPAQATQPVVNQKTAVNEFDLSLDPSACKTDNKGQPTNDDCWYLDHVLLGGNTVSGRTPIQNPPNCPQSALCLVLPDRSTNLFASYLLQLVLPVYSTTVATPDAAYFDASPYRAVKLTVQVNASPNAKVVGDYISDNTPEHGCPTPATIRPYFMHSVGAGQMTKDDWRWWAFDPDFKKAGDVDRYAVRLVPGETTLTVPLDPQDWVDVAGQGHTGLTDPQGWQTAIKAMSLRGVTLGSGCALGHGVASLGGTVTVTLERFAFVKTL